jgi:diguanylate cyclase (GGDEF)-like protein
MSALAVDVVSPDVAALLAQGLSKFRRHEPDAAQQAWTALLQACPQGRAALEARWWLVRNARREGRLDEAMQAAHQGLDRARQEGDVHFECRFRALMARTLKEVGQNEDAVTEAQTALRLAVQAGDAQAEAHALEALACMHWAVNDTAQGLAVMRRLQTLAERCGDLELQVMALLGQASMHDALGNEATDAQQHEQAGNHWQRALALHGECERVAEALGDRYLRYCAQLNRACTLQISGDREAACAIYEQLLAQPVPANVRCQVLIFLGGIARSEGRLADAIELLQRAVDDPALSHRAHSVLMALNELVDAQEAAGDLKAALASMRRLHKLHLSNASAQAAMHARALEIRFDTERAKARADLEAERAASLQRHNEDLARQSMEDPLTGIPNRRAFEDWARMPRRAPVSLALLDVDHFKQVNDGHSHAVGDAVLRRVATLIADHCRRTDLVARYGGEEFVLVLEGMQQEVAAARVETMRAAVQAEPWAAISPGLTVTISAGLAASAEADGDIARLLGIADQRLYAAKRDGRNRVVWQGLDA